MTNPENSVIVDIDALIDEQLAGGPIDDYERNYYPQCRCGHDWHGVRCVDCSCPNSECPIERPSCQELNFDDDMELPTLPWLLQHIGVPHLYTISDIEALRGHRFRRRYQS